MKTCSATPRRLILFLLSWHCAACSADAPMAPAPPGGPAMERVRPVPPGRFDLPTELPFTYVRDYKNNHLNNPDYVRRIAQHPPVLLVVGKDLPIHHNWGPVQGTGGENQAYGKDEHIRRISPDELREKMKALKHFTDEMHRVGVRRVMPYICTKTIGGDHEKRTGLWEFYDHWQEYKDFAIGPRPVDDPLSWMRRRADGSLFCTYQYDAPYYAPNFRYAACGSQRGWRQYLSMVVRLAAEVGFDGVYMDNNCNTQCYCPACRELFRRWLCERYDAGQRKALFGFESDEDIRLGEKPGTFLWHESRVFWAESNVDFLRHLKAQGESVRKPFHIFSNLGAWLGGIPENQMVSTVAGYIQSEENGYDYGAHSGLVRVPIIGDVSMHCYNNRAVRYKFTQATRSPLRVTMTTRARLGGERRSANFIRNNPQTVELNIAESTAFSGRGAYNCNLRWGPGPAMTRYRRFIADHADLFQGYDAFATVAIWLPAEQAFYGGSKAALFHECERLAEALMDHQILYDLITDRNFHADRLKRYPVIVVPAHIRYVSDEQLGILRDYVAGGGKLVLCDEHFAQFDACCRERAKPAFPALRAKPQEIVPVGKGQAVFLPTPPQRKELVDVLERIHGPASLLVSAGIPRRKALKVNAFGKKADDGTWQVVLHLLNYHVPLGKESTEPVEPMEDLRLALPLRGMKGTSVTLLDPRQGEPEDVPFVSDGDTITFTVPRLDVHKIVRVRARPE